ncbi:polysaccharide deacetylase family protein [Paraflavitalea soli]|uniref:Polysaccharide deacetylase family protein n=1 Tax=Paraflavitalea soli TaxID=2315862 RepID=A0A3B7MID6_9BACT|nr:polysaccharide deacetylase family protein [Paraflavitalea soli]
MIMGCLGAGRQPRKLPPQVPILCYHNIRSSLEGHQPDYTIDRQQFRQHLKVLSDSGYHSITPDQLYQYLTRGIPLPEKPVMITFDDNRLEHYTIAAPMLRQYGFTGVFFIMTVTIGKPGYMSAEQLKKLSDDGHCIGNHTWDHPDMRKLTLQEWRIQVDMPRQYLEKITGRPVQGLAYPYGAWNEAAIKEVKARNVQMAFQLMGKMSNANPLYSIRRLQVSGNLPATELLEVMRSTFREERR